MDLCSKFIFIRNQVSLGAGKTLVGKHGFEFLLCTFGFYILTYYGEKRHFCLEGLHGTTMLKVKQLLSVALGLEIKMELQSALFRQ